MDEKEKSFLDMIDLYKRLIYKVCYMYSSSEHTPDDLFQDVTLNLWKAFSNFRHESSHETWIYRIALNTCISQLRKQKSKPAFIPLNVEIDVISENYDESRLTEMYNMIKKLDSVEKAIVFLYLEDKSYDEIATMIGITKSNVGVKLSRIKEKLKQMSNQ